MAQCIDQEFRFIAFNMISTNSLACAATPEAAINDAVVGHRLGDNAFVEVLDCGENGLEIWTNAILLGRARKIYSTVFRGAGYDPYEPAVKLVAPDKSASQGWDTVDA